MRTRVETEKPSGSLMTHRRHSSQGICHTWMLDHSKNADQKSEFTIKFSENFYSLLIEPHDPQKIIKWTSMYVTLFCGFRPISGEILKNVLYVSGKGCEAQSLPSLRNLTYNEDLKDP